jgi:hypothetical protein
MKAVADFLICWSPCAFAFGLLYISQSRPGAEVALYMYLPMCFFFASLGAYLNSLESRQLRRELAELRRSSIQENVAA